MAMHMMGVVVAERQMSNFSAISWREQVTIRKNDDDDVSFVLYILCTLCYIFILLVNYSPQKDMSSNADKLC